MKWGSVSGAGADPSHNPTYTVSYPVQETDFSVVFSGTQLLPSPRSSSDPGVDFSWTLPLHVPSLCTGVLSFSWIPRTKWSWLCFLNIFAPRNIRKSSARRREAPSRQTLSISFSYFEGLYIPGREFSYLMACLIIGIILVGRVSNSSSFWIFAIWRVLVPSVAPWLSFFGPSIKTNLLSMSHDNQMTSFGFSLWISPLA